MQQGSSMTEQLVYRTSYRKHRERLVDIRHNAMLHDFLLPPKPRPEDKKGQMKNKIKHDEITYDNKILKGKINSIKNRNFHESGQPFSTEEMRMTTKRYDSNNNNDEGCRFQIQSDFDDDNQPVKCILPGKNGRAYSFASHQKKIDPRTQKRNSLRNNFTSSDRNDKKFQSFNMSRQNAHQMLILQQKQPQIEFNLLQRNQNRKVIYKKTIILSPMQSALLELSLISGRLLVVAYLMGIENYRIRELFSEKKTKRITKDCKENYEELCSKITLEKINDRYEMIKINGKESEVQNQKKVSIQQDINKNKFKLQNEFIKRNYYLKKQKQEQIKQEVGKEQTLASIEKVQALVERLAIPRKYSKEQNVSIGILTKKGESINSRVMSKPVIPPIIKQQFHKEKVKEKKQSVPNKDLKITHHQNTNNKKTQEKYIQKQVHPQKDKYKINERTHLEQNNKNNNEEYRQQFQQEDEEVQYLGDDNDEYAESFQNPSELKNQSSLKQISEKKSIRNNSSMMKHKQEAKASENSRSDMYQDIYEEENEKQKEKEEQNYQEQFEESKQKNQSIVKNKKQKIDKEEVVEQDYQEEFSN